MIVLSGSVLRSLGIGYVSIAVGVASGATSVGLGAAAERGTRSIRSVRVTKKYEELRRRLRTWEFDGPIGADTLTAIYNPDTMITAIEPAREDDKPLVARVCPNCGAPVRGSECEYCGSVFVKDNRVHAKRDYGEGERRVRIYDPDVQQLVWVPENPMAAVKTSKVLTTMRWS